MTMEHEDYGGYRHGRGNVSGSDRLQVDTAYATASRTVVESPLVQMQAGLPSKMTAVRPKKIVNPHFIINDDFENLESDDLPALEADTAEGRFITDVFTEEHEDDFTATEIGHLADIAVNGLNDGWQNLDVWEESY